MTDHCFLIWGYNLTNVELLVVMQRGRTSIIRDKWVVIFSLFLALEQ